MENTPRKYGPFPKDTWQYGKYVDTATDTATDKVLQRLAQFQKRNERSESIHMFVCTYVPKSLELEAFS